MPNKRDRFRLVARVVQICLFLLFLKTTVLSAAGAEEVTFPSGKLVLHGFLYRPQGNGPFPAILYNHGSEEKPGTKPALGNFFSSKGYVFFVPTVEVGDARPTTQMLNRFVPRVERELSRCTKLISTINWRPSPISPSFQALTLIKSPLLAAPTVAFKQCLPLKPTRSRSWVSAPL
jgi:hypothetical protein